MAGTVQLNYDELNTIIKNFHDEGEDITQLLSTTRQRVQELRSEWIGDAADKFFDEMEHDLLPALLRLSQALFISQDVLSQITKTIHAADEENAGQFKGDDFGASGFESALGAGGGTGGGLPGGGGLPADFGAGKFEEAGAAGGSSAPGGDAANTPQSPTGGGSNVPSVGVEIAREPEAAEQEAPAETEPQSTGGGGGGGGGGGSGQGLQGDLKQMGVGLVGEGSQSSSAGGPQTPQDLPDHVFTSGGGSGGGGNVPATGSAGGSGPVEPQTGGGSGAAAGIAGVAGSAAAAAAAKALKKAKGDE